MEVQKKIPSMREEYDIKNLNPRKNLYVRENRIPFELSADPFYSKENIEELERHAADIRSGKSTLS